ncbi:hypothetical protein CTAYLR_007389 [Chrysophaeum taylorii]|uniref:PinX1-related protein 1 n=1 Tax=Chrysophaeum taylorii TaxID=2483200 RepID=A0AAD7U4H6_9STRA|nr:hypothetical protein CTAYLR_007389 [Chrysophaeum taylorii]
MEVSGVAERMMKNMGWSAGKGLGKNETGIVASIKVAKRVDGEGLGAKKDHAGNDGWGATAGAFSSALAALSHKYGGDEDVAVKKVKTRAPRIARASVLRSKDTSLYSDHDMKAILGHAAKEPGDKRASSSSSAGKKRKKASKDSRSSSEDDRRAKKKTPKKRCSATKTV